MNTNQGAYIRSNSYRVVWAKLKTERRRTNYVEKLNAEIRSANTFKRKQKLHRYILRAGGSLL